MKNAMGWKQMWKIPRKSESQGHHPQQKLLWIKNNAKGAREFKSGISITKAAFNKKILHRYMGLKFKEETSKLLYLEHSFV
jgi:hypothetical protein